MRKPVLLFTCATLALSAAGALLRRAELKTALEAETGLAVFVPATGLLIGLSVLAALAFFLLARFAPLEGTPEQYGRAFHPATFLPLAAAALSLLATLAGCYFCLCRWRDEGCVLCAILALMGGLSAAGWFSLNLDALRGKRGGLLAGALQVLFVCFFLIVYYKEYAPEPALVKTVYPFLALCAAVLALYELTGFTVGKTAPRKLLFLSGLSVYLITVAVVGLAEVEYQLFLGGVALELLISAILLLQPRPEPAVKPEDGAAEPVPPAPAPPEPEDPPKQA